MFAKGDDFSLKKWRIPLFILLKIGLEMMFGDTIFLM